MKKCGGIQKLYLRKLHKQITSCLSKQCHSLLLYKMYAMEINTSPYTKLILTDEYLLGENYENK